MAYALEYNLPFKSQDGDEYRLDIYLEGGGGGNTELTGFNPCRINYKQVRHVWEPIRGSEMIVELNSDSDFKFSAFFTAAYGDYKAVLVNTTSSTNIWVGYNVADIYSEPYVQPPYPVKLKFTDGLAEMKNIEFINGATLYSEQMHLIQVLRLCLNNLATPLNIFEAFNVYEDGQNKTSTDSALAQTYVDTGVYRKVLQGFTKGMTCYEILGHVLGSIGCFITQRQGAWWIVRARELQSGSMNYREFAPAAGSESGTATASTGSLNPAETISDPSSRTSANEIVILKGSENLEMEKKIRRVVYTYEPLKYNFNSTLLRNATFDTDLWVNADNLPAFWERQGLTEARCTAAGSSAKIMMQLYYDGSHIMASNEYVENVVDNIFVQSTDLMGFSTSYSAGGEDRDVNIDGIYYIAIRVILTDNTSGNMYELDASGWNLTTGSPYYIIYAQIIPEGGKVEFGEGAPPFTGDAKLEFRIHGIFPQFSGGTDTAYYYFDDFTGYYRDSSGSALTTLVTEVEEVDSINEDSTFEINAFHGDGPDYPSNGSFRLSDDTITDAWERASEAPESISIHDVLIADVLDMRSDYARLVSLTLRGSEELYPLSRIRHTLSAVNYDHIPLRLSWNVQTNTYNTLLFEVNNFSYSSSTSLSTPKGGAIGGESPPPSGTSSTETGGETSSTSGGPVLYPGG